MLDPKRVRCLRSATMAVATSSLFLLAPAASYGSTASVEANTFRYHAAAGETNDVGIDLAGSITAFTITLTDNGAVITPGNSCESNGPHQVRCPTSSVFGVDIDLGDLDDALSTSGAPANTGLTGESIHGGEGNDRLTAAPDAGERAFGLIHVGFDGGPGNDVLTGVEGSDSLRGGLGDDVLNGGAGIDLLSGSEGDDELHGGPDYDRLDGRGGNDQLFVNGTDLASGGAGNDLFRVPRPDPASIVCGTGRDSTLGDLRAPPTRGGPWFSKTCEEIVNASSGSKTIAIRPPNPVRVSRAGKVTFRVPCAAGSGPCRGVLTLSGSKHPFPVAGKARFTIRRSRNVTVGLTRRVTRAARRRPVRLRARLAIPSQMGRLPVTWRFELKLP